VSPSPRSAPAPAKVNLFLHVGGPGDDGYHPICSLMAFADVGDVVTVEPGERLSLRVEGPFSAGLGAGDDNLVMRAARALCAGGPEPALGLILDKRLPVAAGLGGGSSDAGAALRLLCDLVGRRITDGELEAVATSLGADGAACLWARTVLAEGRGERLSPAPGLPLLPAVLVNPCVPVSTPAVYRRFDDRGAFGDVAPPAAPPAFATAPAAAAWLSRQRNDLEASAIDVEPRIGEVLAALKAEPETLLARVSGSGGTCFALCAGEADADRLAARIAAAQPGWWVRPCRLGGPAA
jgi:4-diphosphocytidyl-2-C-methyl-D-erythritol kinase